LGPYQAQRDDQPLTPRHSRKEQWLLALLTLRHGLPVERDWLAGTLWPESHNSRALLRDTLSDLRRSLGPHAERLHAPTAHTLCLDLEEAEADILQFDAAIAQNDPLSLEAAVALYRGPLLEGCTEEWVLPERERREHAYLQAREHLAAQALEAGDPATAVGHLRQVIVVDPLRESAQCDLMQALAAQGEVAAVTQVYRELRLVLHRDLHAEPAEPTQALYQQIQAQARSQAKPPPRLPAPAPAHSTPRLPVRLTRFFGREAEITRLQALLSAPSPIRLVTLTGPGGSGKTRLALETAERLQASWEGALWFVRLAPLSNVRLLLGAIVEALGLAHSPDLEPLEQVVAFLNGMGRPALMILDNLEHLLAADASEGEGGAYIVGGLLEQVRSLRLLVTSRQSLNLEGEQEFSVLPLPIPGQQTSYTPEPLLECASVQLFVDRAQAVKADFEVTQANAGAIAALCTRLEGLPLTIELAAAHARTQTPAQMLSALEHRFEFLVSRKRDAAERHKTLRAALDWSYRLLSPELQRSFARLSVFRGGWTAEAAEAVCAPSVAQEVLTSLQECSLILAEEQDSMMRFRMLETLREYGWEQMDREERPLVQARHARHYLDLAEQDVLQVTPEAFRVWLDMMEPEQDNFRAALAWGLEAEGAAEIGAELVLRLFDYWEARNSSEAAEWIERIVAQGERVFPLEDQAHLLRRAGHAAKSQDDRKAIALYTRSEEIFRELGNTEAALNCQYLAARTKSDVEGLRAAVEQMAMLRRERGEPITSLDLEREISLAWASGDFIRLRESCQKRLLFLQELGDWPEVAITLHVLGYVTYELGDLAAARAHCEQALPSLRMVGDRPNIALVLNTLGQVACEEGNYPVALQYLRESLTLKREIQNGREIIRTLNNFAYLALRQDQMERAACLYGAAAAQWNEGRWHIFPSERQRNATRLAHVRATLSEQAFLAAWEEGCKLTREQAIAHALEEE
jgi:predicted ATPase/DNA-binding SARP family transcriptional activator